MSRRRTLVGVVFGLLLPAGAVALYLQYIRVPPDYEDPDTLPRRVLEERSARFRTNLNRLLSLLLSGQPFDVTFTDRGLNAYLAVTLSRTGRAWYERWRLPPELEGVQVAFHRGEVEVMGRYQRGLAGCILSVRLRLGINRDGDLEGHILGVRGGRVPLPPWILRGFLRSFEGGTFSVVGGGRRARLVRVEVSPGRIRLVGRPSGKGQHR